ncbi:hypothetical protein [Jannaschia seohaensis]|uniref:Glyceraldehyde-3-phosphate dehydrogenase n=1 Tax=Jannaschia seohaensis TaxID=475081 RepID=A0A2Y9AN69_9RHOB|nr:hypothetical protein [Jannaschia seohaensis]PWJ19168.1 hypothetical protein BCF38_10499 [Jannaschia seohaensis]SSA45830.1 hypothetical protein SAMN05421539_10499 [Jannaschia seohaensis]
MTNKIAIGLGFVLLAFILADIFLNGSEALLFLARRLLRLIELVAFWR